ncbi:HNH endonuclease [Actinoplanes derwentensis]|uniref:HNH endonuclease n=1 Tax=Actinoplanes derwentensis TaxID=113562 RepID=UPI000B828ACE|nr:HNH endonuclease [Actinoplanes derwentensis]
MSDGWRGTNTYQWRKVRDYVLQRDNYECQLKRPGCTQRATTGDHIVPLSKGGSLLDPNGIRAACHHCNSSRQAGKGNPEWKPGLTQW